MYGKYKCKLLKKIREKIARENDIEFESEECTIERDCSGTCPKCEDELAYLENEIAKKEGKVKDIYEMDMSEFDWWDRQGQIQVKLKEETDEIYVLDGMPAWDYDDELEGLKAPENDNLEKTDEDN